MAWLSGDWIDTLYILGAVQGLFLTAVLASKGRRSVSNRLLAGVMLVFSVDLFSAVYHSTGLFERYPHFIGVDFPLALLYGPLVYLYVRTLTAPERGLLRRDMLHFAPFVALLAGLVPFFAQSGADKILLVSSPEQSGYAGVLNVLTHLKLGLALVYVGVTVACVVRYRRQKERGHMEQVRLRWVHTVVGGTAVLALGTILLFLFGRSDPLRALVGLDPEAAYDDITLLSVTGFVYTIGYLGLRKPEIFDQGRDAGHEAERRSHAAAVQARQDAGALGVNEAEAERPKYVKSGMDAAQARAYLDALLRLMETEKPYRNGDLTLSDLADALEISPHNLSEVINTQLGKNFYDFVNAYRVREVQERLRDPASAHLTVLAIGLEAGFQSKSSFNAAFKKHVGMTPSAYRRQEV